MYNQNTRKYSQECTTKKKKDMALLNGISRK